MLCLLRDSILQQMQGKGVWGTAYFIMWSGWGSSSQTVCPGM